MARRHFDKTAFTTALEAADLGYYEMVHLTGLPKWRVRDALRVAGIVPSLYTRNRIADALAYIDDTATKTTVTCTVNLDAAFSQAPGTMFAHILDEPTALFTNTETAANAGESADDIEVAFEAVTAGALVCDAGTLTVIETPITGWNTITNTLAGVTGDADTPVEVDQDSVWPELS